MKKLKIGISTCLLGKKVRYDGRYKKDQYITDTLAKYFKWVPVCPEVEYGLPVPREAMRLSGNPDSPRLVTISTGIDRTEGMIKWSEKKLKQLEKEDLCGFIFRSKSPTCGIDGVKIYKKSVITSKRGKGLFASSFIRHFPLVPVIDDMRLHNQRLKENFLERVFIYTIWKDSFKLSKVK
jgi:uncharacterized protein YbbK (DUF523 family)